MLVMYVWNTKHGPPTHAALVLRQTHVNSVNIFVSLLVLPYMMFFACNMCIQFRRPTLIICQMSFSFPVPHCGYSVRVSGAYMIALLR